MAKFNIIKNNFSSGELSPILSTRSDVAQYSNGARTLINVIPLVEGGVKKRPGTLFHFTVNAARLIPFVSTSRNAFLIILKTTEMLVYDPKQDKVIATLNTPYAAYALPDIHYVHNRYVMYFTHQDYKVSMLECSEDFSKWAFSTVNFDVPPTDEVVSTPNVALTPSGKDVGAMISLIASPYPTWSKTVTYFQGDRVIHANATWVALRDNIDSQPSPTNGDWETAIGEQANVFKPEHIGAIVQINGGYVRITEFSNPSQVLGEVIVELTAVVQAIAKSWVLKTSAFNAELGYPKCCSYFKQRLVFANTKKFPNKIWFSRVGNTSNFLETTDDADAFSVVSSSDQSDSIVFLSPQKGLIALTSGAEFLVSSDGALTPTTAQINEFTAYGAYPVARPCRVGNELLFVQRGGGRLRALSYRYEVDGLVSPEINTLSAHIAEQHKGIKELTFQQEPQNLIWIALGDGRAASITFNREQEVVAWAQHDFSGDVLSVCSLPSELGSDYCFMLIKRENNVMLEQISLDAFVDCQRTIELDVKQKTFDNSDFSFVKDMSIYQRSDEYQYSIDHVIKDNIVTLQNTDTSKKQTYYVGQTIHSIVDLFPPEISEAPQTSLSAKVKCNQVVMYFYKTQAPELNNKPMQLYTFANNPLAPPKPFTGRHLYESGDWSDLYEMRLTITHNKPLPFHLQAIAIEISINER